MPALSRMLTATRGPRFYGASEEDDDGEAVPVLMFVNYLDGSTRDGPRHATEEDAVAHPKAWGDFVAELEAEEAAEANQARLNEREPRDHPFRPMVTWSDPPEGPPVREESALQKRRSEAKARGETA